MLVSAVFTQRGNICYREQLDNKQLLISIEDAQRPNPSAPVQTAKPKHVLAAGSWRNLHPEQGLNCP